MSVSDGTADAATTTTTATTTPPVERTLFKQLCPSRPQPASPAQLYELDTDTVNMYVTVLYIYRNHTGASAFMPTDALAASLHATLDRLPVLYGRYGTGDRPHSLAVHPSTAGVPVYETRLPTLSMVDCDARWPYHTVPYAVAMEQMDAGQGDPLFAVNISRFADNSGVAIGIAVHHYLIDVTSVLQLMQQWAATMRGKPAGPLCLERGRLRPPLPIPDTAVQLRQYDDTAPVPAYAPRTVLHLYLPAARVAALKADATATLPATTAWISTMDALTALMMRVHLRADRPARPSTITLPVNLRPRYPVQLGADYFGSALSHAILYADGKSALIDVPIGHAAALMRATLCSLDESAVAARLHRQAVSPVGWPTRDVMFRRFAEIDYAIADWTKTPLHAVDFGWGYAECVRPAGNIQGPSNSFFRSPASDGIETYMAVPSTVVDRVLNDSELFQYAELIE